jgi:orotate phosphoribosyltransferase
VGLPCIVVRKQEKTYGATGRIVGAEVSEGEKILFFDDVISEGLSKLEGIKPLEELGARIRNVLVVVDREQGGKKNLEKLGYEVHALAKVSDIVNSLLEAESISKEQTDAVMNYIRRSSCEA